MHTTASPRTETLVAVAVAIAIAIAIAITTAITIVDMEGVWHTMPPWETHQ